MSQILLTGAGGFIGEKAGKFLKVLECIHYFRWIEKVFIDKR